MDDLSATARSRYWTRRTPYKKLHGSSRGGGLQPISELTTSGSGSGSTSDRRKRFSWRIRIKRRLRFWNFSSPKKFFARLRDGYVKLMLSLANSRALSGGLGYQGNGPIGKGPLKEYDERIIVQIYKEMIAQGHLVPRDPHRLPEPALIV